MIWYVDRCVIGNQQGMYGARFFPSIAVFSFECIAPRSWFDKENMIPYDPLRKKMVKHIKSLFDTDTIGDLYQAVKSNKTLSGEFTQVLEYIEKQGLTDTSAQRSLLEEAYHSSFANPYHRYPLTEVTLTQKRYRCRESIACAILHLGCIEKALKRFIDDYEKGALCTTSVVSDSHGLYDIVEKLEEKVAAQALSRRIYLGDYLDRGPKGIALLKKIFNGYRQRNTIIMLGNHDLFFISAMLFDDVNAFFTWMINGGFAVLSELNHEKYAEFSDCIQALAEEPDTYDEPLFRQVFVLYKMVKQEMELVSLATELLLVGKIFYIDQYGTLYTHAGLPVRGGLAHIIYDQHSGREAIVQFEKDWEAAPLDRKKYLFETYIDPGQWLWVVNWEQKLRDEELFMMHLGITRIIRGHNTFETRDDIFNYQDNNRILGIDGHERYGAGCILTLYEKLYGIRAVLYEKGEEHGLYTQRHICSLEDMLLEAQEQRAVVAGLIEKMRAYEKRYPHCTLEDIRQQETAV